MLEEFAYHALRGLGRDQYRSFGPVWYQQGRPGGSIKEVVRAKNLQQSG
jgi:hypothetical protein